MGSGTSKSAKKTKAAQTKLKAAKFIANKSGEKTEADSTDRSGNQEKSSRRRKLLEFVKSQREDAQGALAALNTERATDGQNKQTDENDSVYTWPEKDEVHNVCPLCGKPTMYQVDGYACRVCARAYHMKCLRNSDHYSKQELEFVERAKTSIGWSCKDCDNITTLLTADEITDLTNQFETLDMNKDDDISLSEFMDFQRKQHLLLIGQPMSQSEEESERRQFNILDIDRNGSVSYIEFLKHRATLKLAARSTHLLVTLLTPWEKLKARLMFEIFDQNQDGAISMSEARQAYRSWYTHLENLQKQKYLRKNSTGMNKASLETAELSHHVQQNADLIMQSDEDHNCEVDWKEFLRGQSLYILSSRPNKVNLS